MPIVVPPDTAVGLPRPVTVPVPVQPAITGAASIMGWLLTHSSSPHAGMYTAGLVPIVVYGNLVQRFRFKFAFAFSNFVIGVSIACAPP